MFQFRRFPAYAYLIQRTLTEYCSAGFPHSEILGYNAYVQLPQAYRSLSRPSSAPDAKAFPLRSYQLDLTGSQELCRPQIRFIVVCVTLLKVHKFTLLPLCCLLAISCLLHCSVFKVQVSNLFQGQIEMLGPCPNTSIRSCGGDKRNRTAGLLLARQALSQLSYTPVLPQAFGGGPKWTRTTDLTIISRAL